MGTGKLLGICIVQNQIGQGVTHVSKKKGVTEKIRQKFVATSRLYRQLKAPVGEFSDR